MEGYTLEQVHDLSSGESVTGFSGRLTEEFVRTKCDVFWVGVSATSVSTVEDIIII
jgi:hypothetical protein